MRHPSLLAASLGAALLAGAAFAGTSAHAAKKPVTAPAAKIPEKPPAESGEAEAKEEAAAAAPARRGKRPVVAPGSEVVTPPPAVVEDDAVVESKAKSPSASPAAAPEPDAPPPEFQGLPIVNADAGEAKDPVADPAEARTSVRLNNFQYTVSVRPGRPKVGTPVEVVWRVQEILHIPDPFLGDRKPADPVNLLAKLSGPEPTRAYEVHALDAPGTWGIHFTPAKEGAYKVQLERADGKPGHRLETTVWVGVPPPPTVARGVNDRSEELIPQRPADDRSISGVMSELGRRWMALERSIGTAQAAEAVEALREQVAKVAGKVPSNAEPHALEFDELAKALTQRVGTLAAPEGNRDAALRELQQIQDASCMRCHTRFRFGLAENVRGWPSFELKKDMGAPATESKGGIRTGRGPVAPPSR